MQRKQFLRTGSIGLTGLSMASRLPDFLFKNKSKDHMNFAKQDFEVIIIGGSYAGLSAAMALGRAVRQVLVVDGGKPCNRQTPHSHNFLTQDGQKPAAIAKNAKKQVLDYPTVHFMEDMAEKVSGTDNNFTVTTAAAKVLTARKILLATGIKDVMIEIPGFAACWGISVIHCPYCHGYEVKGTNTGILTNGPAAPEFGRLINHWTKRLTIFTNGGATFDEESRQKINKMGIEIVEKEIGAIAHEDGKMKSLLFKDGSEAALEALYARPSFVQHSEIPVDLGCEITPEGYIETNEFRETTVAGVFAAGDNSGPLRAVSVAVAAGTTAGAFMNHQLIEEQSNW